MELAEQWGDRLGGASPGKWGAVKENPKKTHQTNANTSRAQRPSPCVVCEHPPWSCSTHRSADGADGSKLELGFPFPQPVTH